MLVEHQHATSDPTTTDLVQRSGAALKAGQPWDAEQLARTAIGRDQAYVPARLALGRALEAQGQHAQAAALYAEAARISPFSSGVGKSLRRVWIAPLAGFGVVSAVLWWIFRVVGRQFDQRTVLYGLLISTAVLIAGTLLVLQHRRRRFASLTVEDRRLLEARSGLPLLAIPSPGRLLAVGTVMVVLSAAAVMFAAGSKTSFKIQVGDCFTLTRQTSIESVSTIPCDLPHGVEVFATVEYPAPPGAPYPGAEAIRATITPGCQAAYEPYVGTPWTRSARWSIGALTPEEPYWAVGVRTNFCTLGWPGQQTSGSARGSGG